MLSFFKKTDIPLHTDKVWKTRPASLKGMMTEALKEVAQSRKPIIVFWFNDRLESLLNFLDQYHVPFKRLDEYFDLNEDKTIFILDAKLVFSSLHSEALKAKPKAIIADGHYPLVDYENKVIEKLCGPQPTAPVLFCQSLADPFLQSFGSDHIISLLEKLGLDENESLDHPMIRKALEHARKKISDSVSSEIRTQTEGDWFIKNVKKS
jgi:hypothetical protein